MDSDHRVPDDPSSPSRVPVGTPLIWVLVWTGFVAVVVGWFATAGVGPSVWVFQERDLAQPGFSERVESLLHSDLGLQRAYPWLLLGPYLALVAWYFPLERERLGRRVPLHLVACLIFLWACQGIHQRTSLMSATLVMVAPEGAPGSPAPPLASHGTAPSAGFLPLGEHPGGRQSMDSTPEPRRRSLPPPHSPRRSLRTTLRSTIVDLLAYGALTGLAHSVHFHRRLRERERRALFLESSLAKSRLNALKAQLQPHFLFNSLNAIAALLRRDPRLAETTLVALSGMLRLALSQSDRQEGALRDELDFVERYLEIQRVRFGDKLGVEVTVEPETLECRVPTLVLQPLVENAIRHGIEPAGNPGTVRVGACRCDDRLVLTVEDDGVGLHGSPEESGTSVSPGRVSSPTEDSGTGGVWVGAGTGIGLANLRERLQALYGNRQSLELTSRREGGVVVRVTIPWLPRGTGDAASSFER